MRFIPEESIGSRFLCEGDTEVHEIVAETVRVEACVGELFACQRGDLAVFRVVLQELGDLFAAEIFADAPWIENDFQAEFMAFFDDFRDVRPPKVEIEFCDGEIDGVATVGDHFLKIYGGVFDVSETVVADGGLRDGHGLLLFYVDGYR